MSGQDSNKPDNSDRKNQPHQLPTLDVVDNEFRHVDKGSGRSLHLVAVTASLALRAMTPPAILLFGILLLAACTSSSESKRSTNPSQQEGSSSEQKIYSDTTLSPTTGSETNRNPVTPNDQAEPATQNESGSQTELGSESSASNTESKTILTRTAITVSGSDITMVAGSTGSATVTMLFLHGAAFTSETWVENGILLDVAAENIDAVAIDLPGFGSSPTSSSANKIFLAKLISELGLDPKRTVVVSPSMSGAFSLPALRDPMLNDLAGYVGVAPVGVSEFLANSSRLTIPALVIWGDRDGSDPQGSAENLASGFASASVVILPNAGHAAYQHQPELFTETLLDFVRSLELD